MSINDIANIQKEFFYSGSTKDFNHRIGTLNIIKQMIKRNEDKIIDALYKDFGKSKFETYMTEIGIVYSEIEHLFKKLEGLMRPKLKLTELPTWPAYGKIYPEPYGSVLIISPWNYPFMLSMMPLVGAVAAGNTVVLKPSTNVPNISKLMAEMINDCFSEEYITVINGTNEDTYTLLEQRFDYIFFTGGVTFGRTVMEKAAKNLIPVTLELGGKSPVIVDSDANIKKAAKRIAWGKFINAGQTCVAPDYALLHEDIKEEFIACFKEEVTKMYGKNPLDSKDLPNIVNEKSYTRLLESLENQNIIFGGEHDDEKMRMAPTIVDYPLLGSKLETEEIFGPILPIRTFSDLEETIDYINRKEKPLAFYYFGNNKKKQKRLLRDISFGGGCFNEVIMHLATSKLPFGGVGHSGMGSYHGEHSFKTFTHYKSVLHKIGNIDIEQKYAPYDDKKYSFIRKFMK